MQREPGRPLTLFLIAIHLAYFIVAVAVGNIHLVDSFGYLNQADNIMAHQVWYAEQWKEPFLPDYFTFRPPLYAFFILLCHGVVHSDLFILAMQSLLSILNFLLVVRILRQLGVNERRITTGCVIALVFCPSQLIHANLVMTEILFQALLTGTFYFAIRATISQQLKHVFILCVLLSLAMLTKPVIFLFGIALFVFFAIRFSRTHKRLLLPFMLIALTWHMLCYQNSRTTGYYHYSSASIMADLRVNARYVLATRYGADSSAAFVTHVFDHADRMPAYGDRYTYIQHACREVYVQNKLTFTWLYARGMVATLIDPGRFDISFFFGLQDATTPGLLHRINTEGLKALPDVLSHAPLLLLLGLLLVMAWNVWMCVALLTFLLQPKQPVWLRLLVLLFVGYIVGATGISGLCRYRIPVYPIMVVAMICGPTPWQRIIKRVPNV